MYFEHVMFNLGQVYSRKKLCSNIVVHISCKIVISKNKSSNNVIVIHTDLGINKLSDKEIESPELLSLGNLILIKSWRDEIKFFGALNGASRFKGFINIPRLRKGFLENKQFEKPLGFTDC